MTRLLGFNILGKHYMTDIWVILLGKGTPTPLAPLALHPAPLALHPAPLALHPAPYTLPRRTWTLHLTPCSPHPAPCSLHPRVQGAPLARQVMRAVRGAGRRPPSPAAAPAGGGRRRRSSCKPHLRLLLTTSSTPHTTSSTSLLHLHFPPQGALHALRSFNWDVRGSWRDPRRANLVVQMCRWWWRRVGPTPGRGPRTAPPTPPPPPPSTPPPPPPPPCPPHRPMLQQRLRK